MALETPVAEVKGFTRPMATAMKRLGIGTVRDLIFYFPFRFDGYRTVSKAADIIPGDPVIVSAELEKVRAVRPFRRRVSMVEARFIMKDGPVSVIWFNQPYLLKSLVVGKRYRLAGSAKRTKFGLRLVSPLYEVERPDEKGSIKAFMPVYPLTSGVSQHIVRRAVRLCREFIPLVEETYSKDVVKKNSLTPLTEALSSIHFPEDEAQIRKARRRLGFDELLRIQLAIGRARSTTSGAWTWRSTGRPSPSFRHRRTSCCRRCHPTAAGWPTCQTDPAASRSTYPAFRLPTGHGDRSPVVEGFIPSGAAAASSSSWTRRGSWRSPSTRNRASPGRSPSGARPGPQEEVPGLDEASGPVVRNARGDHGRRRPHRDRAGGAAAC